MNFPTNLPRTKKLNIKKNLRLGKRIRLNGLDMFIRENKDISSYKPGVIISKKISNKAVVRNKYKRIIREVFRLDFKDLTSKEIVFVVNKKILDFDFNRTRKELSFARKRITK
jgi:ribonuclease P protein component|tara:strand:+ start:514 stop:852 length:339 start_codon:yes stop_codon:yes gene_type:complete